MELDGSKRAAYRLVVGLDEGEIVFDAQPVLDYKGAVARVAAAVRCHAREGRVRGVSLQRRLPLPADPAHSGPGLLASGGPVGVDEWTTLEHWGTEVVDRIIRQRGDRASSGGSERSVHHRPRRSISGPSVATTAVLSLPVLHTPPRSGNTTHSAWARETRRRTGPAAESRNEVGRRGSRRPSRTATHRWHLVVTVAVVAIAWLGVAFVMAGGRLDRLLGGGEVDQRTVASELPFHAPKAVSAPPLSTLDADRDQDTQLAGSGAGAALSVPPARSQ